MLKANCQIVVRCPPAKQQDVASLPEISWNTFLVRRSIAYLFVIIPSLAAVTLAAFFLFALLALLLIAGIFFGVCSCWQRRKTLRKSNPAEPLEGNTCVEPATDNGLNEEPDRVYDVSSSSHAST